MHYLIFIPKINYRKDKNTEISSGTYNFLTTRGHPYLNILILGTILHL